jgi:hypothetical protein
MNSSVRRAIAKQMWKTIISACFGLTLSNCMENSELPVHPQESSIKRGATQIVCNEHSHEDVKEALFRYLIAKMGDLTCCLAVENGDPSDEFMKRFANIGVLRASECNWKGEGIIKDKNGEYASSFRYFENYRNYAANNSLHRTHPAPRNVMPVAIG